LLLPQFGDPRDVTDDETIVNSGNIKKDMAPMPRAAPARGDSALVSA